MTQLRRFVLCGGCGRTERLAELRQSDGSIRVCRRCWETDTDESWSPARPGADPEPLLEHGYVYTLDGWMLGEVRDYAASSHSGHVTMYGAERHARRHRLGMMLEVRAERDDARRRDVSSLHTRP